MRGAGDDKPGAHTGVSVVGAGVGADHPARDRRGARGQGHRQAYQACHWGPRPPHSKGFFAPRLAPPAPQRVCERAGACAAEASTRTHPRHTLSRIQASEFHLLHFRKDISEGRPGIISIIYEDYVWVNWENGAGSWYNTGRDGRYELIERYMLTSTDVCVCVCVCVCKCFPRACKTQGNVCRCEKQGSTQTQAHTHIRSSTCEDICAGYTCMYASYTHTLSASLSRSSSVVATCVFLRVHEQTKGGTRAPHLHSQCRTARKRGGKGGGGGYLFVFKDTGTNTSSGVAWGGHARWR